MEWYWLLLIATILLFCFWVFYRIAFIRGYRAGARRILAEWKETLNEGEIKNDKHIQ